MGIYSRLSAFFSSSFVNDEELVNDELAEYTGILLQASEWPFLFGAANTVGEASQIAGNIASKFSILGYAIDAANFVDNVGSAYSSGGATSAAREAYILAVDFANAAMASYLAFGVGGVVYKLTISDVIKQKAGEDFDEIILPMANDPSLETAANIAINKIINMGLGALGEMSYGDISTIVENVPEDDEDYVSVPFSETSFVSVSASWADTATKIALVQLDDYSDEFQTAEPFGGTPLTSYSYQSGTVEVANDVDWFSVSLVDGQTYGFLLSADSSAGSELDPFLTVRLPNGTLVTNDDLITGVLSSYISFTAAQTGLYQIQASGVGMTIGSYGLLVTPIVTDTTATGLTQSIGETDDTSGISWDWQGDSGNNSFPTPGWDGNKGNLSAANYLRGHDGDDRIEAGAGNDVVWGDDDDDRLYGESGDDILRGGRGEDRLYGDTGEDLLYGERGDDYLSGGDDDDTLYGGDGDDRLRGGDGDDYLKGEDDDDDLNGGDGDDELYGDGGIDDLDGDAGNDLLFGGFGNDELRGGPGHDRLAGEDGDDVLEGEDGDDLLYGGDDDDILQGGKGNDLLHGERGNDTADFSDGRDGVTVNLFDEISTSTDLGTDILYDIENIIGSDGDDIIDGDHGANSLSGLDGDDAIRGHNGNDVISGGDDNDVLWGDAGDDIINGDDDEDELRGGLGADILNGGRGDDYLRGEQGDDVIDGGEGTDTAFFWGEREDFLIITNSAGDIVVTDQRATGLEGQDTLRNVEIIEFFDGAATVEDLLSPNPVAVGDFAQTGFNTPIIIDAIGNDTAGSSTASVTSVNVLPGEGTAYIVGGKIVFDPREAFDDLGLWENKVVELTYSITSSGLVVATNIVEITVVGPDTLSGTSGDDTLIGSKFADKIFGYGGNDTLIGGDGNDLLRGGSGVDKLLANDGDDAAFGNAGNDRLFGGDGDDELRGGNDDDFLSGQMGNDRLFGDAGVDRLVGSFGEDELHGGAGDDSLASGADADMLFGDGGNDDLFGGAANDILEGGTGDDMIRGESGLDILRGDAGADQLFGGFGSDDLFGGADNDELFGFQGQDELFGEGGDDMLFGGDNSDELHGGDGNDIVRGQNQGDMLFGDAGNDNVNGGQGNDLVDGGTGTDFLTGGTGNDTFVFATGYDDDSIADFDDVGAGNDVVDITSFGLANFAAVQAIMTQAGVHVDIDFGGGDTLRLRNTLTTDLDASDFLL